MDSRRNLSCKAAFPPGKPIDLCRTSDAVLFCLQQTGVYTRGYLDILRSKLGLFGSMRSVRIFPALAPCAVVKDSGCCRAWTA